MEFLDDDSKPRFLFQSRAQVSSIAGNDYDHHQQNSKPFLFITITISSLLIVLTFFTVQSEPFRSLLFWFGFSLLIGPFAPISITGGDIRVGLGPEVEFPDPDSYGEEETRKRSFQKRVRPRRPEDVNPDYIPFRVSDNGSFMEEKKDTDLDDGNSEEEKDWTERDVEFLKKQLVKHPPGKMRRWEVIAETFGGRYKVDSVIKKSKELGEKKSDDKDSYTAFLKNRKPLNRTIEGPNEGTELVPNEKEVGASNGAVSWNAGEDVALLNALKAFPKDVSMRWEKIAAAVPGKSKAACAKRVAELKRDFRSSKAANEG